MSQLTWYPDDDFCEESGVMPSAQNAGDVIEDLKLWLPSWCSPMDAVLALMSDWACVNENNVTRIVIHYEPN